MLQEEKIQEWYFRFFLSAFIDLKQVNMKCWSGEGCTLNEDRRIAAELADYYGFELRHYNQRINGKTIEDAIETESYLGVAEMRVISFPVGNGISAIITFLVAVEKKLRAY